jgi:hypothetical protein
VRETQAGMHFDVGGTRRDRTGDLLITKFHISLYAIDITFGPCPVLWVNSVSRALIESDFESRFLPALATIP